MRFKDNSVKIQGIRPEMLFGLNVASEVYKEVGSELVITSLNDAKHKLTSLHYCGCAADLRTRNLRDQEQKKQVRDTLKKRLGTDYDVVLESDHIHLEYQPRRR